MPLSPLLASLLRADLGALQPGGANRLSVEGLQGAAAADGSRAIGIRKLEASSLQLGAGALAVEIGHLALHDARATIELQDHTARLALLEVGTAEITGLKLKGPVDLPQQAEAALHGAWSLAPLGTAEGTLRAEIVDAHLVFDADVTVPIRQGQVDFNAAMVEHVGPDSRMGVSRLGAYVDAPNGRSYLYQFTAAPVAGVEFERRGALLGRVADRGRLRLQEFLEGLLRQPVAAPGHGITDQARQLFDRTALSGHLQLGDGRLAAPGVQVVLAGRAKASNLIRLHSGAVGRDLRAEIAALQLHQALVHASSWELACGEATGALRLQLFLEGQQARFELHAATLQLGAVRLAPSSPSPPPTAA